MHLVAMETHAHAIAVKRTMNISDEAELVIPELACGILYSPI